MAIPSGSSGSSSGSFRPGFKSRFPRDRHTSDEHRINERIRVPQVRLIDEKGNQVGIVDTREALRMAQERGLDLMEVAENANPPVCKICDYGKFKYEKKKKEHQAKKKQVTIKVKEVQLRPSTDTHDLDYKFRNARGFLEEGDKVKFSMLFRGRQITQTDIGMGMMRDLAKKLEDIAVVEYPPRLEGRKIIMILAPSSAPVAKKPASTAPAKSEEQPKTPAPQKA